MPGSNAAPSKSPDEAREEITAAFENNDVVLFMKGTPLMPQCGYSRTALNILKRYRDDFTTINVLEGPVDVYRDELEERSNWTTIPQLYVDGEFIGGADILEELHDRGQLEERLDAEPTEPPF